MRSTGRNYFEAARLVDKKATDYNFNDSISKLVEQHIEEEFDIAIIERLHNSLVSNSKALNYLASRGIDISASHEFKIGYSDKQNMTTVPVQDHIGRYVGFVGRSVEGKSFKNSNGLPRRHVLFNLNRSKYEDIVVVESSFDAIRLWQLGIPSVATLGSYISKEQLALLNKWAKSVIVAPDKDEAGKKLVDKIKSSVNKDIRIIELPEGKKDVGDLTDQEILEIFANRLSILI